MPELHVHERWPDLAAASDGEAVFPRVTAHMTPGHTPGSLVHVFDAGDRDMEFTSDACKNRTELLSRAADMTYHPAVSRGSIEAIWELLTRRPGSVLMPGHDLRVVFDAGAPRYLGRREAAVRAWYGEDLNETTLFSLLPAARPGKSAVV